MWPCSIIQLYQRLNSWRLEQLLTISKGRPFVQFLATFIGMLNVITSGMHYGWSSPSLPILQANTSAILLTSEEGSTVATILIVGTLVGGFLAKIIIDKIGTKFSVLVASIPGFASWMILAFAHTKGELIVSRFLGGICDAVTFCAMGQYISEIAQPKYRGLLGSAIGINYMLGNLLINIIGARCTIRNSALICSSLPVILILTFCCMPESPYYLLMKKKVDQAKKSLRIFNGRDNNEVDFNRINRSLEEQYSHDTTWWDLLKLPSNRRILIVVMVIRAVQQGSGETPILFYAQTIFADTGSDISPADCTAIFLCIAIIASVCSSLVIDRIGRKPLLIISMGGSAVSLFLVAAYFYVMNRTDTDLDGYSYVVLIALTIYVFMFGIALQTIPVSLPGELFPTNLKSFGLTFNEVWFCVIAIISGKYFQMTKDAFGLEVPFLTFGVCSILGIIFTIFCVLETKNKTLEDIQFELKEETTT